MSDALLIRGGAVRTGGGWRAPCDVAIADGHIVALAPELTFDADQFVGAAGLRVVPGLVDLHLHGAGGAMFEDGTAASARRIVETLPRLGTTSLLATIGALSREALQQAVEVAAAATQWSEGARVLGIHLEGPFLNPRRAGAQHADWMRPPSPAEIEALQRRAGGAIRLVTLAPELPGALELIAALRAAGISASLGHSDATAEQVEAAIAAGASQVTHLFNAMGALHHRAPGVPGIALTRDELAVEVIADGVHVDRRIIDLIWRCKPAGRTLLVSDGVAPVGGTPGPVTLFGAPCIAGDAVRRVDSGQLAGSCTTLADALRNVRAWMPQRPLADLVDAASAWPARALGLPAGEIAIGAVADLAIFDADLRVVASVSRGVVSHPA